MTPPSNRWFLREIHYPIAPLLDARPGEVNHLEPDWLDIPRSVTRIEALWQHIGIGSDGDPFPTFKDLLDVIYESEKRFGKSPDVIVVTPPIGTKYFGIEIR